MATKKIVDLQLRSDFDATCNLPADDASQTWRVTGAQILAYILAGIPQPAHSAKTANYTMLSSDDSITVDASGGAVTISLPAAAGVTGKKYTIKRIDNTLANAVTIDPNGAELIDGVSTRILHTIKESVVIQSNGTGWIVLEHQTNTGVLSFTPTWTTNTGTQPSIGNGSISGTWQRVGGDRIKGRIRVVFGTTTNGGANFYQFTGPANAAPVTTQMHATNTTMNGVGSGICNDTGAATYPVGSAWDVANSVMRLVVYYHSSYVQVNDNIRATVPVTWATGDEINFDFEWQVSGWWA